jgi:hypothetical protein
MSGVVLNDAMSELYATVSKLRSDGMEDGKTQVTMLKSQQDKAIADWRADIARRAAAEANSGGGFFSSIGKVLEDAVSDLSSGRFGKALEDVSSDAEAAWQSPAFWNDLEQGLLVVAKVAAVVGSAAATIVTAGAAGGTVVAVALFVSAGGMTVSETGCLDGLLGRGWSSKIGLGLEIGGTVLTMGANLASTAASAGLRAVSSAGAVATTTSGAATIASGAVGLRVGDFRAEEQSASADVVADTQTKSRLGRLIDDEIQTLNGEDKSAERQAESIVGSVETNNQTEISAVPTAIR